MQRQRMWFALLILSCSVLVLSASESPPMATPGLFSSTASGTQMQAAIAEKAASVGDLEARIQRLEKMLITTAVRANDVPLHIKMQLSGLYAQRPGNRREALDQGNDTCPPTVIGAIPYTDSGTTAGMANNFTPTCAASSAPDVIYSYTPAATAILQVSLCGSAYDTMLAIRSGGACPGTVQDACNDDFCGLQSQITFTFNAGTTYYIIVDGWSTSSGAYTLNIDVPPPPCSVTCPGGSLVECPEDHLNPDHGDVDCDGGCNSLVPTYQNISCGQTVCGVGFTYVAAGGGNSRDTDWYYFTLVQPETVIVTCRAEFPMVCGVVNDVDDCIAPAFVDAEVAAGLCSLTTVVIPCLAAGNYAMFVGPNGFDGVPTPLDYVATLECRPCAPCVSDLLLAAPGAISGNTCGAGNDCGLFTSEEQIIEVMIPADGQWTFSLCNPDTTGLWDSYIYLSAACCGVAMNEDDDGCGIVAGWSEIACQVLTAGTYYVAVEGFSDTDCGPYTLSVSQCAPCDIVCDPLDLVECAETPDSTHSDNDCDGGCNVPIELVAMNLVSAQPICARTFTYTGPGGSQSRDTDWFRFQVTCSSTVLWTVSAEVAMAMYVLDVVNCDTIFLVAQGVTTNPCVPVTIGATGVPPGEYYAFAAPTVFTGVPMSDYRAQIDISPCAPPNDPTNLTIIPSAIPIPGPNPGVMLRWLAPQSGPMPVAFNIYQADDGGTDDPPGEWIARMDWDPEEGDPELFIGVDMDQLNYRNNRYLVRATTEPPPLASEVLFDPEIQNDTVLVQPIPPNIFCIICFRVRWQTPIYDTRTHYTRGMVPADAQRWKCSNGSWCYKKRIGSQTHSRPVYWIVRNWAPAYITQCHRFYDVNGILLGEIYRTICFP